MTLSIKKLCVILFELSFIALLFQDILIVSEFTMQFMAIAISSGLLLLISINKIKLNACNLSSIALLLIMFLFFVFDYGDMDVLLVQLIMLLGNIFVSICLYNYIINYGYKKIMYFIIIVSTISIIVMMVILGPNIIPSRLGHNGAGSILSYNLFGMDIYRSSNGTASWASISALFSLYFFKKDNHKILLLLVVFFTITVFITGSRQGLVLLAVYFLYYVLFFEHKKGVKKLLYFIVAIVAFCFFVFFTDFGYDTIGKRLLALGNLSSVFDFGVVNDQGSLNMRDRIQAVAIEKISQKPIFGNGAGLPVYNGIGAENNFLQLLYLYGIFALLVHYAYLPKLASTFYHNFNKREAYGLAVVLGSSLLIKDFVAVTYMTLNVQMMYSMMFGMIIYLNNKEKKDKINANEKNKSLKVGL